MRSTCAAALIRIQGEVSPRARRVVSCLAARAACRPREFASALERMRGEATLKVTTSYASWCGLEDLEPLLRCYVGRRCGNASEVDDIVQETLLRAARYRTSLADPVCLRGWALSIASNVMRDVARHEARLPRAELQSQAFEQLESREPEPGHVAEDLRVSLGSIGLGKHIALEHIASAMHGMRGADRRLLRSYYWGNRDCARAARECGLPLEGAKVRLFRARQRLTRALMRRFLGASAARAVRAQPAPAESTP